MSTETYRSLDSFSTFLFRTARSSSAGTAANSSPKTTCERSPSSPMPFRWPISASWIFVSSRTGIASSSRRSYSSFSRRKWRRSVSWSPAWPTSSTPRWGRSRATSRLPIAISSGCASCFAHGRGSATRIRKFSPPRSRISLGSSTSTRRPPSASFIPSTV